MRLIDADELKEGLRGNFKDVMGNFVFNTTFAQLEAIIDTAPTVNIKPFANVLFDKDDLERIVIDTVVEPIKKGELVVKTEERPHDWIPVRERLPEGKIDSMTNDFELVLCTTVWDDVRPLNFGRPIGHDKAHFWRGSGIMDDYVVAWMPLPEAYKEVENGQ